MSEYRGVDKIDILKSVLSAGVHLQKLDLGPKTNFLLKQWIDFKAVEKLVAEGRDNQSLAVTLNATSTSEVFALFAEIFEFQALVDLQDQIEDPKAFDRYTALRRWGGLDSQATKLSDSALDAEIEAFMIVELAKRLTPDDINPDDSRAEGFRKGFDYLTGLYGAGVRNLPKAADDLLSKFQYDGDEAVREVFMKASPTYRDCLVTAFLYASNVIDHRDRLPASPLDAYALIIPDFDDVMDRNYEDVIHIKNALKIFAAKLNETHPDEIMMIENGRITKEHAGIVFEATKRAAQSVADAFVTNKIMDREGHLITRSPPSRPNTGFTPPSPS